MYAICTYTDDDNVSSINVDINNDYNDTIYIKSNYNLDIDTNKCNIGDDNDDDNIYKHIMITTITLVIIVMIVIVLILITVRITTIRAITIIKMTNKLC